MNKALKIKMISLMGLIACVALTLSLTLFAKPVATVKATTPTTFEMLGMSIRYDAAAGNDGIRFGVRLDKSTYNTLAADGNAVAGILVAPSDVLTASGIGGVPLNLWNAGASNARYGVLYNGASGTNCWTVGETYAEGIVYIHGFPEASYNRPITAVAYIDWDNDSSAEKMNYSDTVEVSMSDVALAVRTDYEGSNTYETTSSQYDKLNAYLLSYNVRFLDAYNNNVIATQSVKYGSELTTPVSYPAARTGYTYNGWYEKNGESSYSGSATNFNASGAKVVKYARTFKAGYSEDGPTFVKPAANNWLYGGSAQSVVSAGSCALKGMYLFDDTGVSNGSDYMLSATFTRASANEVGFVITTKTVPEWNGSVKNLAFVYRSGGDMYLWGTSIWRSLGTVSAPSVGDTMKLTIVHTAPMFYVFINDTLVCSVDENTTTNDGDATPKNAIGTSGNIKFGLASTNAVTTFTDWRYSTDSDLIDDYLDNDETKPLMDNRVNTAARDLNMSASSVKLTTNGNSVATTFFTGVELSQSTDFVLYATVNSGFTATGIGFVIASDTTVSGKHLLFHWMSDRIAFWRTAGGWTGYDGTDPLYPGFGSNSASKALALVYKSGRYYLFMNGTQVFNKSETEDIGWGTVISTKIGTDGNKKIGLSLNNGTMTCSDWGYSTDASVIWSYLQKVDNPAMSCIGNATPESSSITSSSATIQQGSGTITAYYTDVELSQSQTFVIYTTVSSGFAAQIGFVVATDPTLANKQLWFHWRSSDIYLWRSSSWPGHPDNKWTPGYGSNSSSVRIALVYKNGYYYMFFNGVQKAKIDETANTGWGGVPRNAIGTEGTKKIGLSASWGTTTFTGWGYSLNSTWIDANYPTT